MENNIYPIKFDRNRYVIAANDLIRGKSEMTLQEARLVRLLIMQIAMKDGDLKTYQCPIKELAQYLEISVENLYRDMHEVCHKLIKREIGVATGNPKEPWFYIQWIQLASYDGHDTITLMLSNQIAPYVLELSKWFTKYKYSDILTMNSYHAIRLYELLKCYDGLIINNDGAFEFTVEYLRMYFNCEKKYKNTGDFTKIVLETAKKEINDKSDISINYDCIRNGRKILKIKFYISPNYKRIIRKTPH